MDLKKFEKFTLPLAFILLILVFIPSSASATGSITGPRLPWKCNYFSHAVFDRTPMHLILDGFAQSHVPFLKRGYRKAGPIRLAVQTNECISRDGLWFMGIFEYRSFAESARGERKDFICQTRLLHYQEPSRGPAPWVHQKTSCKLWGRSGRGESTHSSWGGGGSYGGYGSGPDDVYDPDHRNDGSYGGPDDVYDGGGSYGGDSSGEYPNP